MTILIIGIALFLGVHLLPSLGGLRTKLVRAIGAGPYKGLFSVFAAIGLVLIIVGKGRAVGEFLYTPLAHGHLLSLLVMLPALVLIAAANMRGRIRKITRHPMMFAVLLWSLTHLSANGDTASVVLFASFAGFAILSMLSANMRGPAPSFETVKRHDFIAIGAGILIYAVLLFAHPILFGPQILL